MAAALAGQLHWTQREVEPLGGREVFEAVIIFLGSERPIRCGSSVPEPLAPGEDRWLTV
jgi:hypothetical protein